jgi:hypothetical protein
VAAERLEIITHANEVLTALCMTYPVCKSCELNIKNKRGTKIMPPPSPKRPPRKPPNAPVIRYNPYILIIMAS